MAVAGKILSIAFLCVLAVHVANGGLLQYLADGVKLSQLGQLSHNTLSSAAEVSHTALTGAHNYLQGVVDHYGPLPKIIQMALTGGAASSSAAAAGGGGAAASSSTAASSSLGTFL